MKKLVRATALGVALAALCAVLAACGAAAPGPAQTVESALQALTSHDYAALQGYYAGDAQELAGKAGSLGSGQGIGTSDDDLTDEQKQRLLAVFDKLVEFDYAVGEESIDGDKATVQVSFTNYDIGKAATGVIQDVVKSAFRQALSDGAADESAMTDMMLDSVEKAAGDLGAKNVTKDATVRLTRAEDGSWKIDDLSSDEEYAKGLANAMLGGAVDSVAEWAENLSASLDTLGAPANE